MSYSATISFKKIKAEEVFNFFLQIKKKVKENFDKIAEENFIFSPYAKNKSKYTNDWKGKIDLITDVGDWAKRSIFNYRYFYIKELELLGVYGCSDFVREMFDDTIYFQNSCDQDYEFETWDKIEAFKVIANKYMNMTPQEVWDNMEEDKEWYKYDEIIEYETKKDRYLSKTLCYKKIWETYLKDTLYSEDTIVYLALFGYYETFVLQEFSYKIKKLYDEFEEGAKK